MWIPDQSTFNLLNFHDVQTIPHAKVTSWTTWNRPDVIMIVCSSIEFLCLTYFHLTSLIAQVRQPNWSTCTHTPQSHQGHKLSQILTIPEQLAWDNMSDSPVKGMLHLIQLLVTSSVIVPIIIYIIDLDRSCQQWCDAPKNLVNIS